MSTSENKKPKKALSPKAGSDLAKAKGSKAKRKQQLKQQTKNFLLISELEKELSSISSSLEGGPTGNQQESVRKLSGSALTDQDIKHLQQGDSSFLDNDEEYKLPAQRLQTKKNQQGADPTQQQPNSLLVRRKRLASQRALYKDCDSKDLLLDFEDMDD